MLYRLNKDSGEKDNAWEHPRLANLTTAGILIVMIAIGIFAYCISEGTYNKPFTFHLTPIRQEYNLTMTAHSSDGTVLEQKTFLKKMILHASLTTKSPSAQSPIDVQIVSEQILDIPNEAKPQDTLLIFFPDADNYPPEPLGPLSYNAGVVKIYWNEKEKRYEGNRSIMYQFESEGGYFSVVPNNFPEKYFEKGSATKNPDGTITVSFYLIGNIRELVYPATKFHVEPTSTTINLKMNNIVQAISILVINVGLIQSRKQIILGVFSVYRCSTNKSS